ncbi:uncharacterized protein [Watersipora subatra]|uniref:uncharacterized protein n=1 Tax=Watersipora subatra TaxID=2589382 RepID=UPI00355B51C8
MEHSLRYNHNDYGNDDYAQLTGWSEHPTYKTPPHENFVYTSDYGSYSSQESNHSGTTYSNLADCEEALSSSSTIVYDMPPPQLTSTERRRDKPLPPPRMTSTVLSKNQSRIFETTKEKKISFDDSSLHKEHHSARTESGNEVPSFATLPRKKKQAGSSNGDRAPVAPQVTWMKEVAQKGESINRSKSASSIGNKKPQGILKNKIEAIDKKGDTTGYIKRNTVQRIMEQQRAAKSRMPAGPAPMQLYKSQPGLTSFPATYNTQQQKPWEYKTNNSAAGSTAKVLGVVEPGQVIDVGLYNRHTKENSSETELEFPPPPSAQDINQFMSGHTTSTAKQNNDSTHLKKIQPERNETNTQSKVLASKPPVPHRTKKPVANSSDTFKRPSDFRHVFNEQTIEVEHRSLPTYKTGYPPPMGSDPSNQRKDYSSTNFTMSQVLSDIVLPPPEFQEGNGSALATQQPSYGDYEVLLQDCVIPSPALSQAHHNAGNLMTPFKDSASVKQQNTTRTQSTNQLVGNPHGHSSGMRSHNRKFVAAAYHQHQYSTEL